MVKTKNIYEDVAFFIASIDAEKVISYKASFEDQKRYEFLVEKQREEGLTAQEKSDLDHLLVINKIIGLAKAKAFNILNK